MADPNLPPTPPSASDLPEPFEIAGAGRPPAEPPIADATEWLLREADLALSELAQCAGRGNPRLIRRTLELLGRLRFELRQLDPDAEFNP